MMFSIPDNVGRTGWSGTPALHGLPVFVFLRRQLLDPLHQLRSPQPTEAGGSDLRLDHVAREYSAQSLLLHLQQLDEKLVHLSGQTVRR